MSILETPDTKDPATKELLADIAAAAQRIAWWVTLFGVLALMGIGVAVLAYLTQPSNGTGL